jgi:probable phosphomutase (TIGR03848 family)
MTLRTGLIGSAAKKPVTIYLLRHAHSEANSKGILAGRRSGIKLSARGRKEAKNLIKSLNLLGIQEIHSSPLERCLETIAPFSSQAKAIPVMQDEAFIEMHYGDWSGSKLSILSRKKLWKTIQGHPSLVRFPSGESFLEMNTRAIEGIEKLRLRGQTQLVVSHGDVIRVILNHYLGSHLDNFQKLSIEPASLSRITFHGDKVIIHSVNVTSNISGERNSTLGGGAGKS